MKIALLGDIALIGKYDTTLSSQEEVFSRLGWLRSVLDGCDYVVGNLESPLTDVKTTHEAKSMPLRSATVNVSVLKYLGIDAVSLANNHIYDFGNKGLEDVLSTLDKHGIRWFGIGNDFLTVERNGEKIAFQGFCCFTANGWHYDELSGNGRLHSLTVKAIDGFAGRAIADGCYPVIIPHWGDENTHYPKSEHVLIAKHVLNNYKCSIVGHHPHVSQGMIKTDNGLCAFSLGNLLFDDCYSEKNQMRVVQTDDNKHGYVLVLDIQNGILFDYELIPYYDSEKGIAADSDGERIITEYSDTITSLYGRPEYEQLRQKEQAKAREKRLGKRDLKWLKNHMNYSSVMSVVQRKINQRQFSEVVDGVGGAVDESFEKAQVYYIGNFGMPHTNAPGKRVYANALLFAKCGYDVLMIGTDPAIKGAVQNLSERISYISFPTYGKSTGKQYYTWLKKRIDKSGQKPRIIVRYGSPGLATFDNYISSYCKKNGIILINDVVDWLSVDSGNILFKAIKGTDTYLEKALFNKRGDGLIAISSYLYDYYGEHYKSKIVIPPLVEKYQASEVVNEIPQIVYAGNPFRKGERVTNVHAIKDRLDLIITCLGALLFKGYKFDLHIIGMTDQEYLTAFPGHRDILNQSSNIHFYGRLPMDETQRMIAKMDYSILLRDRTRATMAGFPTKVVESISLGVPVITTDTSDLKKYIQEGKTGYFVDIEDENKLETGIANIIDRHLQNGKAMKTACASERTFVIDEYLIPFQGFINSLL